MPAIFREKIDETTTDRFHRPTGRAWLSMTRWTGSGQVVDELGSNTYSIWDTRDIVWSINLNFREDVHGDGEEKTNGLSFALTLKNSFFHIRFFLSLRKCPYFLSKHVHRVAHESLCIYIYTYIWTLIETFYDL